MDLLNFNSEKSNGNLVKNCAENLIKIADSTDE